MMPAVFSQDAFAEKHTPFHHVHYALTLWNLVIRPPRAWYDAKWALGPQRLKVCGRHAVREDVRLRTSRGLHLECSHYRPAGGTEQMPVVIYLHGNSSCRLEVFEVLPALLDKGISVFCYDAAGCGLSEGEYISLGWHEQDDLACVVAHLRRSHHCGSIGLWGRSMGAVTALLYADGDAKICALCADSPFASLPELMLHLASTAPVSVPKWLASMALALVGMRVRALANFDLDDVVPLKHVQKCRMPAIFLHAVQDNFVPIDHVRRLFCAYAGGKELLQMPGDHNSRRDPDAVQHAAEFLSRALSCNISDGACSSPGSCSTSRRSFGSGCCNIDAGATPGSRRLPTSPRCGSAVLPEPSLVKKPSALALSHHLSSLPTPNRSRSGSQGDVLLSPDMFEARSFSPIMPRRIDPVFETPLALQQRTMLRAHHAADSVEAALDRVISGVAGLSEAAELFQDFQESEASDLFRDFDWSEALQGSPEPEAPFMPLSSSPRLSQHRPGMGHHSQLSASCQRRWNPQMRRCLAV